jgi:hypothetical protein
LRGDEPDPEETLAQLRNLVTTVLPRYGSLVKSIRFNLQDEDDTLEVQIRTTLAQVMASVPNLVTLEMNEPLVDIVSASPVARSLTSLKLQGPFGTEAIAGAATIISSCLNLIKLELDGLRDDDPRPLVAATASHASLEHLRLKSCGFHGERFATADWKCPLKTLKIWSYFARGDIPFRIFHPLVSHFATTLTSLSITAASASWYHDPAVAVALRFSLPHLATLEVSWQTNDRALPPRTTTTSIIALFDDSSIKDASLRFEAGTLDSSPTVLVQRFIDTHKGTLKTLETRHRSEGGVTRSELEAFIPYAKELGIKLTRVNYPWK